MGGVDFRSARRHEPPRAKRKCRVVLRNSRSRSSSHSENDAEYLMGLRKTGSSREYNSIDVRFSTTINEMALAMRHQSLREQSAITEGDDEIEALTQGLARGMRIDVEETPISPEPVLETILESTEPIDESSATHFILEEYLSSDAETEAADNEALIAAEEILSAAYLQKNNGHSPRAEGAFVSREIQFVGYAPSKWKPNGLTPGYDTLPPFDPTPLKGQSTDVLPSLFDIGVVQYLSKPMDSSLSSQQLPLPLFPKGGVVDTQAPHFRQSSLLENSRLPAPVRNKPVHYPHKPLHYAPYGTV